MSQSVTVRAKRPGQRKDKAGNWLPEAKFDLISSLVDLGNLRKACEVQKIPWITAVQWSKQDWWPQMMEDVKAAKRAELQAKMNSIVDTALSKVQDRLENGDFVLNNKTGEILRKPVNLKDSSRVATDLINTSVKLEQQNQTSKVAQESVGEMLKTLAQEFAKFTKKQVHTDVIDIPFREVNNADEGTLGENVA